MKRKISVCLIIALSLLFTLTACNDGKILSVELAEGSFKAIYDLDEELDLSEASVVITYKKTEEKIPVTADMVTGFYSATTGERTLTVTYGENTFSHTYRVVYSAHQGKDVVTTARLHVAQQEYPTGIGRVITLSKGDLGTIKALSFTLNAAENFADADLSRYEVADTENIWSHTVYVNAKTVRTVLYFRDGYLSDEIVVHILGNGEQTVAVTEITVSDGVSEYYLPDTPRI